MKLEKQVNSLEQAKRLKELGVDCQSFFTWISADEFKDAPTLVTRWTSEFTPDLDVYSNIGTIYEEWPALTVAELGKMLPKEVGSGKWDDCFGISVTSPLCGAMDDCEAKGFAFAWVKHETEAQARAAILIYLLENNLIAMADVNKSLL